MMTSASGSIDKRSGGSQRRVDVGAQSQGIRVQRQREPLAPNTSNSGQQASAHVIRAPLQAVPGAFAVDGPECGDTWEDSTVFVGNEAPQEESAVTAVDAVVVDTSRTLPSQEPSSLPPLVDAQVDRAFTIRDRRVQIIILVLLVAIGTVLGVIFGAVLGPPTTEGDYPTPTISPSVVAPTSLSWVDAGAIDDAVSSMLDLSRDGTHLAIASATGVRVYENIDGSWEQLGNLINVAASSVSLSADTWLAVGSVGSGASVFSLQSNTWTLVGNAIGTEAWTVALSQDGTAIAVEATNAVQVYQLNESMDWVPKGSAIPTTSGRVNEGSAFTRLAMNNDATLVVVDLSVYQYDANLDSWTETNLAIESSVPDTPVSMSGDGQTVAIAQPQSNINGLNSGRVRVFRSNELGEWTQLGNDIIGNGAINGFWGWSHALSGDGSRIAIMNNPSTGQKRAIVFRLEGSSWISLLEEVPSTVYNGTIDISEDGGRVAVGGEGVVRFYDIVGV